MKLIIDIDDNVFTRLFDNGVDTSSEDRKVIDRAVRNGTPYEERPQGEWVDMGNMEEYWEEEYQCSICGAKDHWHKFCPNCGADMRKEAEND